MTLKDRMLNYRARNRVSQKELALRLGTTQMCIWRIENEKTKLRKANVLYYEQKMTELECAEKC